MWSGIQTLVLGLWAPLLTGALAATVTWLVWRYTALPCTPETAIELMCRPGLMSRYLSATVLHHGIIHASIAMTITGGSDLMLFLRERQRNNEERRRNDQMMELMKTRAEERKPPKIAGRPLRNVAKLRSALPKNVVKLRYRLPLNRRRFWKL